MLSDCQEADVRHRRLRVDQRPLPLSLTFMHGVTASGDAMGRLPAEAV